MKIGKQDVFTLGTYVDQRHMFAVKYQRIDLKVFSIRCDIILMNRCKMCSCKLHGTNL